MTDQSLRTYLREYQLSILLACIASAFLATVLWHLYPTFYECCDALDYLILSYYIDTSNPFSQRTFVYPTLIAITGLLQQLFGVSLETPLPVKLATLSFIQLGLHAIASIALGYIAYSFNWHKVAVNCAIYVSMLNIFLLAYTNQILTDGVTVSVLTIAIAMLLFCLNQIQPRLLYVGFSGLLVGLLPLIRPSLAIAAIALSSVFSFTYLYKHQLKTSSFLALGVYGFFCLIPLSSQLLIEPDIVTRLARLSKFQSFHGAYIYKYFTKIEPVPRGAAAINQVLKDATDSCVTAVDINGCLKNALFSHPWEALKHYAIKFWSVNDQVYLTPYVRKVQAPVRHVWRLINCGFSAIAVLGGVLLVKRKLSDLKLAFIYKVVVSCIVIGALLLPLIVGAPEERFGLTFHPFLALLSGYFISQFWAYKQQTKLRVGAICLALTVFFLCLSWGIESSFTYPMNRWEPSLDLATEIYRFGQKV